MFAVTAETTPRVVSFDATLPGTLLSSATVSGLSATESILGIDKRPANATIYALTADGPNNYLRTLDPASGALGAPMLLSADPIDATNPFTGLDASQGIGVDFNPVVDRLRIVTGGADDNLRVNPSTGLVLTDNNLNPGTPQVVAAAYTNNFLGAVSTTLYDYDFATNALVIQNPPNNGTLTTVGTNTGITAADASQVGFDILSFGGTTNNVALLLANGSLYTVDLTAGTATLVGAVGDGTFAVRDITTSENVVGFMNPTATVSEADGKVQLILSRDDPRGSASVNYATSDGSATAGSDYQASSGTITFTPGTTKKILEIPVTDDSAQEGAESFTVTLSSPTTDAGNSVIVFGAAAAVTIAENDAPAAVTPPSDGGPGAVTPQPVPLTNATFAARFLQSLKGARVTSKSKLVPAADGSVAFLTVLCRSSVPCSATYKLFTGKGKKRKLAGSGKVSVPGGEARVVVVHLSKAGRAALRKAKTAPAQLSVALRDSGGHNRTDSSSFTLKKRR